MEFNKLGSVAVVLIVAIILLSFGAMILGDIGEINRDAVSVTNESYIASSMPIIFNPAPGKCVSSLTVTAMYNATGNTTTNAVECISGIHYRANSTNVTITLNGTGSPICNCSAGLGCNITYSCTANTVASNATGFGNKAMTTMAKYVPTIALLIAAAIVVGIIIHLFRQ